MRIVSFETDLGSGYIEYINRDETYKNLSFDVIVEETYDWYTEDDVIADVERNIFKYISL